MMRKFSNSIFAVITSVLLFIISIMAPVISCAFDNTNAFTIKYTDDGETVTAVLSLGGVIDTKCFDVSFKYDKQKYELIEAVASNKNVMINSIPKKGEVAASFADIVSPTEDLNVFTITLTSSETADISDFECEVFDVYDSMLEPISFSLKKYWNGTEENGNDTPIQTTTENPSIQTTTVNSTNENVTTITTQVTPISSENVFYYSYEYNEKNEIVELILGVQGDVNFMGAEGKLKIESEGLSVPVLKEADSGMYPTYNKDHNSIQFSFTSTSGKNVTEGIQLFKYSFEVEDENYYINVTGNISEAFDENMKSVPYSIINKSESDIPIITTSSVQSTASTQPTVSTTTITTVAPMSKNNIFYYSYEMNEETKLIEFIFGIKGDVNFMGAEGKFDLDFEGLSSPVIAECSSGMYPIYKDETNVIQFSFASSDGKNITTDFQLFKYNFEVIENDYKLNVKHNFNEVFDSNMENVPYTVINESDLTPSVSTTTFPTTTTTTTSTTSTTTTTTSTTSTTTTTTSTTSTTTTTTSTMSTTTTATTSTTSTATTTTSTTSTATTTTSTTSNTTTTTTSTTSTTTTTITSATSTTTTTIISATSTTTKTTTSTTSTTTITTTSTTSITTTTTSTTSTTTTTTTSTTSTATTTTSTTSTTTTTSTTSTTTTTTTSTTSTATTTTSTTSTTTTTSTTSTTTSTTSTAKTTTSTTSTTTKTTTSTTSTTTKTTTSTTSTTTKTTTSTTSTTTTTTINTTSTTTTEPTNKIILGDVNDDGVVDASDASAVLAEYANLSTGGGGTFSDNQKSAGDVNFDDMIDASDASQILSFYAYLSTGGIEKDMMKWILL